MDEIGPVCTNLVLHAIYFQIIKHRVYINAMVLEFNRFKLVSPMVTMETRYCGLLYREALNES